MRFEDETEETAMEDAIEEAPVVVDPAGVDPAGVDPELNIAFDIGDEFFISTVLPRVSPPPPPPPLPPLTSGCC